MKRAMMKKAIVLSLALAALPSAHAWVGPTGTQSKALLGKGRTPAMEENNGLFNRANVEATFGNETFGGVTLNGFEHNDFVPLGGGLAILVAAGAGYAALKRRKEERK